MAEYLPLPDLSVLMDRVFGGIFGLPASDYQAPLDNSTSQIINTRTQNENEF
jgi:hypothetical protein